MYTALTTCHEEQVSISVPRYFIDFEVILLVQARSVSSGINKGNEIIFVAHCDCVSIRGPANVYVFT